MILPRCTNCDYSETREVEAIGHKEVVDDAVAATCTEDGLTEGSHCEVCGEILVAQELVPALGHSYSEWTITNAPNCTETGEEERICTNCDYSETREVEATGHKEVFDEAVAATCTEEGLTEGSHCEVCSEILAAQEVIPALGHSYSDWTETKAPTYTEKGEEARSCIRCGETETREIPERIEIKEPLTFTKQPSNVTVEEGMKAVFTAEASEEGVTYQWFIRRPGAGTICTDPASATEMLIPENISNDLICAVMAQAGREVSLAVKAEDTMTYQWYSKKSGAASFTLWTDETASILKFVPSMEADGMELYCISTDEAGNTTTSKTVTLKVSKDSLSVLKQDEVDPAWSEAEKTENIIYITSTADEKVSYQQYAEKDQQSGQADKLLYEVWTTEKSSSLIYSTSMRENSAEIYCVITDCEGNQTTSSMVSLTVTEAPIKITRQPADVTIQLGEKALFSLEASGNGLMYQWYYKLATQSKFAVWSGKTAASFTYTPAENRNGMQLYCEITDADGNKVKSDIMTLYVTKPSITITKQPADVTIQLGEKALFSLEASGEGLSYQWYYKLATQSKFALWSGKTAAFFTYTPAETRNGMQLYCEITDAEGNKVKSDIMTLYVTKPSITITKQPADVTIQLGEKALFSLEASGEGLMYQWYYKLATQSKFAAWSGKTTASFTYVPAETRDGMQLYCEITDAKGNKVTSNTITLKITKPSAALTITKQPTDVTIQLGEKALFSLEASGEGLTYQWYYKLGSANFTFWSGRTTASFSYTPTESKNGMQVYCVVTDASGNKVTSNTIILKITKPGAALNITKQPVDITIKPGEKALFSLEASGEGLTYQWYFKLGSANFAIWSGRTTASFSYTPAESKNGMQVYCVVTDASGNKVTSNTITLKIQSESAVTGPKITKDPADASCAAGGSVRIAVEASGEGLTYQWYVKLPGKSSFELWSGRTAPAFSYSMTAAKSGMQVYCVVTDRNGQSVTSRTAVMTAV